MLDIAALQPALAASVIGEVCIFWGRLVGGRLHPPYSNHITAFAGDIFELETASSPARTPKHTPAWSPAARPCYWAKAA